MMQKRILYDGVPKPDTYYVGTARKKRTTRDRWGTLHPGCVRWFCLDLQSGGEHMALVTMPRAWFGNKSKIHVRIVAEVTKL